MIRFAAGVLFGAFSAAYLIGWLLSAQRAAPEPYIAPVKDGDALEVTAAYPWLQPKTTVTYS